MFGLDHLLLFFSRMGGIRGFKLEASPISGFKSEGPKVPVQVLNSVQLNIKFQQEYWLDPIPVQNEHGLEGTENG